MMLAAAGTIEEPERGTWVADVESRDDASGEIAFAGVTWVGRVEHATRENGRTKARIVGGVGDLATVLPDKWYFGGGTGNTIVSDIAAAIGVPVEPSLPQRVASWQRARASAGEALDTICNALSTAAAPVHWWVDRDGVLRAGQRDSGLVSASVESTGADGITVLAAQSSAGVAPGRTLATGAAVRHARHVLDADGLRVEVSTTPLRVREPSGLGYLRMHRGTVEKQNADGSLDLIVDNTHSLTRVPWLPGAPMSCVLEPGDVVHLASWAGGDPRQWAAVGVSRVPDLQPVSGVGDAVDCGVLIVGIAPPVPPGTGTSTIVLYVAPAPADTFAARLAATLGSVAPPFIATQIPLSGLITSGNPRILAGSAGAEVS